MPSSNGLFIFSTSVKTSLSVLTCAERAILNAPRAPSAIADKPKPAPKAKPKFNATSLAPKSMPRASCAASANGVIVVPSIIAFAAPIRDARVNQLTALPAPNVKGTKFIGSSAAPANIPPNLATLPKPVARSVNACASSCNDNSF